MMQKQEVHSIFDLSELCDKIDRGRIQRAGEDFYRKPYSGTSSAPKVTDPGKIRAERDRFKATLDEAIKEQALI